MTRLVMWVLGGIAAGVVIGATVYPSARLAYHTPEDSAIVSKVRARYRHEGIGWGFWIGAAAGLVAGAARRAGLRS